MKRKQCMNILFIESRIIKFKVVSNATLEENMLELNALDETD